MLEGDSESYVRASAIKAIAAMIQVDRLWNESLSTLNIAKIAQNVLRNDTEAIVRRDAVLLLITILRSRRIRFVIFLCLNLI